MFELLAECAVLSACAACGDTTLKDLAHRKLEAVSRPDAYPSIAVFFFYDATHGCYTASSVRGAVNGVTLSVTPGGPTYADEEVTGCSLPEFWLPSGATIPPGADSEYEVVLSDGSMKISAKFGDLFGPATATLRSPSVRIAHPQDEVIVDFSPAPIAHFLGGVDQPIAEFYLDTSLLANYQEVQLTGSSASFRLPTNVLGQGQLRTGWVFNVPTHGCDGAEVCHGISERQTDLGPFEIRN
jgi:hypothetical protein